MSCRCENELLFELARDRDLVPKSRSRGLQSFTQHLRALGPTRPPRHFRMISVILDASNLQLGLRPCGSTVGLSSLDVPRLHERQEKLIRQLNGADDTQASRRRPSLTAAPLTARTLAPVGSATPRWKARHPSTSNSPADESADDAVVAYAQQVGSDAAAPPAEIVTSGHVRSMLEQTLPSPRPVFAATLLKSAMGKGKRDKREAFLRTCGLTRMGDTVHLPAFEDTQQERALALVRGLHSLERGIIRMERLSDPATVVVSDDRGLRRRCFTLANPPVVLGRKQWENWLLRVEL